MAETKSWFESLSEEDIGFIRRFVLASGSLKEMAKAYEISYPTVRLRLDRLIEKIKVVSDREIESEFERVLRSRYVEGKIDAETFRALLATHKEEMEKHHESTDRSN